MKKAKRFGWVTDYDVTFTTKEAAIKHAKQRCSDSGQDVFVVELIGTATPPESPPVMYKVLK